MPEPFEEPEPDGPGEEEGGGRWSRAAAILYVPLLLAVLRYLVMAAILLAYRKPAGFYAVPYALVLFLLARRAYRLAAGRAPASLVADGLLPAAADLLLALVAIT